MRFGVTYYFLIGNKVLLIVRLFHIYHIHFHCHYCYCFSQNLVICHLTTLLTSQIFSVFPKLIFSNLSATQKEKSFLKIQNSPQLQTHWKLFGADWKKKIVRHYFKPTKYSNHKFRRTYFHTWSSQVALVVENPPANAGDIGDEASTPGSGRCPVGGHCNPLQYCCLENPMDRGDWWAKVQRVAKSQTWLNQLRMQKFSYLYQNLLPQLWNQIDQDLILLKYVFSAHSTVCRWSVLGLCLLNGWVSFC